MSSWGARPRSFGTTYSRAPAPWGGTMGLGPAGSVPPRLWHGDTGRCRLSGPWGSRRWPWWDPINQDLGAWLCGGAREVRLVVGLDDPEGLFQPR